MFDATAEALEPLLQEKDPDQVACGRGFGKLCNRAGFVFQTLRETATPSPGFNQGKRGRIMFWARLGGSLLAHDWRQNLACRPGVRGPGQQTLLGGARWRSTNNLAGALEQHLRRCHRVDQSHRARKVRRGRTTTEHEFQRLRGSDQIWQAGTAAPARENAQLHFG